MNSFRDASAADAAAIDQLFRTSFCDTFAHLYRPEDLQAFMSSFSIPSWEAQLSSEDYCFHVAEWNGMPAGYLKLGPVAKLPVDTRRPAMAVDQLYVLKEHHGTGMARELMGWAIEAARGRGARDLYLTVYIDNHRARRFYEHHGFKEVGRYDFMVGTQADEDLILRKRL